MTQVQTRCNLIQVKEPVSPRLDPGHHLHGFCLSLFSGVSLILSGSIPNFIESTGEVHSGAPGCSQIGGQAGLLAEVPGQPLTLNQALRDPLCDRGPLSQVSSQQCAVPRMDSRVDATPLGPESSVKRVPTPPPSVWGLPLCRCNKLQFSKDKLKKLQQ